MKKQLLTFILSLSFLFSFSQIANQPSDLSLCDSNNDGFEAFDLTSVIAQVIGGQTNVTISFYETQVDVDTGTNIITSPSSYTNSAPNLQTIYVRLEEDATGNYDTTSFDIIVNPLPLLTPPTPLVLCDDGIPDGLATFDLSSKNSEITGNNPNYAISYYSSLVDADNEINPLPTIYTNTTNPQSVFVRVVDVNTGCYNTTTLNLVVEQSPIANTPQPLRYCDLDNDGFGIFNLTNADIEITGGATGQIVTYYETFANADNNVDAIDTTVDYNNIIVDYQTLYARVESAIIATACATIVELQLIVEPSPQIIEPTPLEECDDISADGFASFDLTTKLDEVLNGADATDYIVSYYETPENAEDANNPIANSTAYTNTEPNTQEIWIRVEDSSTAGGCYKVTGLVLIVNPLPVLVQPNPLELCDVNNPGDGQEPFDLSTKDTEILNGQTNISVTYYQSQIDADTNTNAINGLYTNTSNPQTIYARVETIDGCFSVVNFDIIVNPLPQLNIESSYVFCVGNSFVLDTELSETDFNFVWYFNGNYIVPQPGASYTITEPGSYQIQATSVTSSCLITTTTNIEEVDCTDTDNDGVIDSDEDLNNNGNLEDDNTDGDSLPNYLDDDDDGDGVDTVVETNIVLSRNTIHPFVDTDNDLIENYLDDDDDGDGVLTIDEDYNNNGDPTDDDTDMSGIPDYLEANVTLNVNVNEYSLNNFDLYPNPAKNRIMIQLINSNFETGKLNIYNIQGKMIFKDIKLVEQASIIDISSLENGLYFVELIVGNTSTVQKLIVN